MSREKKDAPLHRVWPTQQWERELLRILLTDPISSRRVLGSIKAEWFSDKGRVFIFETLTSIYRTTGNMPTRDALVYELQKNSVIASNEKMARAYTVEIDAVLSAKCELTIDFLTSKMAEAENADQLWDMLNKSWDHLTNGDLEGAVSTAKAGALHISNTKKAKEVIDVDRDLDEWLDEIKRRRDNPDSLIGVPSGFEPLDQQTGGFFAAELIVLFALSGKGKSTVMKAMCNHMRMVGKNVLHVTNEETQWQVTTKYQAISTALPYYKFKWGKITEEEFDDWKAVNAQRKQTPGSLYVLEIPPQGNVSLIQQAFYELKDRGIDIDLVCVDYMDLMAPTQRAYSENDEQAKVTADLLQLAKDCNIPVLTATQASTATQKQESKDRPFLTAQDVYGTKRKAHSASMLIGIVNQTANVGMNDREPDEKVPHTIVFVVPKQRDGRSFWFKMLLHPEIGQFEPCPDDVGNPSGMSEVERQALALAEEESQTAPLRLDSSPPTVQESLSAMNSKKKVAARLEAAMGDQPTADQVARCTSRLSQPNPLSKGKPF